MVAARAFSEAEEAYLRGQRLGRLATVSPRLQPDVAAVSYHFDGAVFRVGGHYMRDTLKLKNVTRGNALVALIVDDVVTVEPWQPRGVKIHGTARVVEGEGHLGDGVYLEIVPRLVWSWGVEAPTFVDGRTTLARPRRA